MLTFYKRKNLFFLWLFCGAVVLIAGSFLVLTKRLNPPPRQDVTFGITFSQKYASHLGLDWKETYLAILQDLRPQRIRLPVYWDVVEPVEGEYRFEDIDWQVEKAKEAGVDIIMVVGRRLPRWPECHQPLWVERLHPALANERQIEIVSRIVMRYRVESIVIAWQVENEPFLETFGLCPPIDEKFLAREVARVRELDSSRPVMVTESGELSTWLSAARHADIVGVSVYRITWNRYLGYFFYPLPPILYEKKADVVERLGKRVVVSELQAEPWVDGNLASVSRAEQNESMNVKLFQNNIDYVRRTGLPEVYLWGAEWWYWLKSVGLDNSLWEIAQKTIATSPK